MVDLRELARARARRAVAVGVVGWSVLLLVAVVALGASRPDDVPTHASVDLVADSLMGVTWVVFVGVGALLTVRVARNGVAWAFVGAGLLQLLNQASMEYALFALVWADRPLPAGEAAAWISVNAGVVGLACFPFVFLLFPTGRPPSPRWWWVSWLAVAGAVLLLGSAIAGWPSRDVSMARGEQPAALDGTLWDLFGLVGIVVVTAALLGGCASMVVRFRRSRGVERQQLKWFVASTSAVAAVLLADATPLLGSSSPVLVDVLVAVVFGGVPASVGIAILQHRLYAIDRLISRTLSYAVLTVVIVGLYAGVTIAATTVVGTANTPPLAVAAATLVAAAVFRPARTRVQARVDRWFNRARYDARGAVESFGARLRKGVDLDALEEQIRRTVDQTVQPATMALWVPAREAGRRAQL